MAKRNKAKVVNKRKVFYLLIDMNLPLRGQLVVLNEAVANVAPLQTFPLSLCYLIITRS